MPRPVCAVGFTGAVLMTLFLFRFLASVTFIMSLCLYESYQSRIVLHSDRYGFSYITLMIFRYDTVK